MKKMSRRTFLKTTGAVVAGVVIVPLIAHEAYAQAPEPEVPPFDPDALAERILKGDRTAIKEAKGVPPRAINQVGERLYIKIVIQRYPLTLEGKLCFQEFMCLKNLPWSTMDHICRRMCKRRDVDAQKWLLGHAGLRERVLEALGGDEREDRHSPISKHWWPESCMPRRVNTLDPEVWGKIDKKAIDAAYRKEEKERAKRTRAFNIRMTKEQAKRDIAKAYLF